VNWHDIQEHLEGWIAQQRSVMDTNADMVIIYRAQGAIRMLKQCLQLPSIIKEDQATRE
jgi:hypothetical protein